MPPAFRFWHVHQSTIPPRPSPPMSARRTPGTLRKQRNRRRAAHHTPRAAPCVLLTNHRRSCRPAPSGAVALALRRRAAHTPRRAVRRRDACGAEAPRRSVRLTPGLPISFFHPIALTSCHKTQPFITLLPQSKLAPLPFARRRSRATLHPRVFAPSLIALTAAP
jgi:hypothetical protein